jgi:hypothetical protein
MEAWTSGAVPAHYAEHTLDIASDSLDSAPRVLALVKRARDAVHADDKSAGRAIVVQLAEEARRVPPPQ